MSSGGAAGADDEREREEPGPITAERREEDWGGWREEDCREEDCSEEDCREEDCSEEECREEDCSEEERREEAWREEAWREDACREDPCREACSDEPPPPPPVTTTPPALACGLPEVTTPPPPFSCFGAAPTGPGAREDAREFSAEPCSEDACKDEGGGRAAAGA
jgi:hypothetical protein